MRHAKGMTRIEWQAQRRRGFTLIELLVVIAIMALLISILLPSLNRVRKISERLACLNNAKNIGMGCSAYVTDPINGGRWMWINSANGDMSAPVGTSRSDPYDDATKERSITSLLYMLVRGSMAQPGHFVCAADDQAQALNAGRATDYYDFASAANISYSYAMPLYNPSASSYRSGLSPQAILPSRVAVLSDESPWSQQGDSDQWQHWSAGMTDDQRRAGLSDHHGGDGIIVLYQDFHTAVERRADVGVDEDNFYTAGGSGGNDPNAGTWQTAGSTDVQQHIDPDDSFLGGPRFPGNSGEETE